MLDAHQIPTINTTGLDTLVHGGKRLSIPFDVLCTDPCVQNDFKAMVWDKPLATLQEIFKIIQRELPKAKLVLSKTMPMAELERGLDRLVGIVKDAIRQALVREIGQQRAVALAN